MQFVFDLSDELMPQGQGRSEYVRKRFLRRRFLLEGEGVLDRSRTFFHFRHCHRGNPNRVRAPQTAATPKSAMKKSPTSRSDTEFLLHPWSTAVSQTKNKMIASTATVFSSMIFSPMRHQGNAAGKSRTIAVMHITQFAWLRDSPLRAGPALSRVSLHL